MSDSCTCSGRHSWPFSFLPPLAGQRSAKNEVDESQKGGDGSHHKSHESKQVWEDIGEEAFAEKEVQSFEQHARLGIFTIEMILL